MSNAASTPEFRRILQDLYDSGKYRTSGEVLREAWNEYRRSYGLKTPSLRFAPSRGRVTYSARNPRKKKPHKSCPTCDGQMSGDICLTCLKTNPIAILEDRKGKLYKYPVKRGQFKTPLELERVASLYHGQDLSFVRSENPGKRYRHASTPRQRRFMGAELRRKRAGKRTVTGMSEKQLREFARKPRRRKNPIAVYNPRTRLTRLPASQVEIRYKRTGGQYAGKWFKHEFKSSIGIYGMSDGSVLLRSLSGKKLWGTA
jgi:hypothetical protein